MSARLLRTQPGTSPRSIGRRNKASRPGISCSFDRYGFGKTGQFDLASLARKYAGQNASPAEVKAYTDGWSKWSNGTLQPDTVIHFAIDEELLDFAKAEFAHEAGAVSPLHDDQILYGFALERQAA